MPGLALFAGLLMSVIAQACPADALFSHYSGSHPGASIAVIKDGAIIYEQSYGMANIETGEKVTPDTNFRLASVTKQFTSMAIMILAERKSLSIDDSITKYLPELGPGAKAVTLRHMLIHTSGMPEYDQLLPKGDLKQVVDKDVLALLASQKLELKPGKAYRYNNSEYALLALVIERVSKQSYGEFVRKNIFKPLNMTSTVTYDPKATIAHRAYGYSVNDDAFTGADQSPTSAVLGDGGIYSSIRDLAHWFEALERNTLVDAKRLAEATSAHVPTGVAGVSYGFGWRISDERGEKLVYHTGTTSGFKNVLLWVPSRKLGVIVLTNRRQGEPIVLGLMLLEQFWDR